MEQFLMRKNMSSNNDLTEEEIEVLDMFVHKVSHEGFAYALSNYAIDYEKYPIFTPLDTLPTRKAEVWLEELMEKYNLEYS
jgi:hypothetical protein